MASSSENVPPNIDPNDVNDDDLLDFETLNILDETNENLYTKRVPQHNASFIGHMYTQFLLHGNPRNMQEFLRIDVQCFKALMELLISRCTVDVGTIHLSIEESLDIFFVHYWSKWWPSISCE